MHRLLCSVLLLTCLAWPQQPSDERGPWNSPAPNADRDKEAGVSSSRDTQVDLSPPKDDTKKHPDSAGAVADAESDRSSDVQEFRPWDPHKAAKDVEVGDFYFKRQNYVAAADRYKEALFYKSDDAVAHYRLAQSLEKLDHPAEARTHYEAYLKILPHGPFSKDAQKALEKLKAAEEKNHSAVKPAQ